MAARALMVRSALRMALPLTTTLRWRARRLSASVVTVFAIALATAASAAAQWVNLPLPGTPRTPDGKPNLTAPAPRTPDGKPDLSGIWMIDRPPGAPSGTGLTGLEYYVPPAFVFPFRPAAEALYKHRRFDLLGSGRPSDHCLPHSVPDAMLPASPFKIVQSPGLTIVLFEAFTHYRQIFTDGRQLPTDPNPAWFGYSIGMWDGNTFVVDSRGFNDKTWLDDSGHPHTDALHTIERFGRRDFGHLDMEVTIDDPKAYTKPWSVTIHFALVPDTELIENICENEKDSAHLAGK